MSMTTIVPCVRVTGLTLTKARGVGMQYKELILSQVWDFVVLYVCVTFFFYKMCV